MIVTKSIPLFKSGVHNLLPAENIPLDAAQDARSFVTKNGRQMLVGGRKLLGASGPVGGTTGIHRAYKIDGSTLLYTKMGTAIKYYDGSAWQTVISGLTTDADYTFTNYSSLAGTFLFINGINGYWMICTANPATALDVYDSTKNFKGYIFIDRGRTILWNRDKDKTGLYGSWIDRQNGTVYTQITNEAIGSSGSTTYSGTLAFKQTTFTVTIAAPGVFTLTAHGYTVGKKLIFATTGALPTGLTAGTPYYVIAAGLTTDNFEVAASPGGTAVTTSGSQSGTQSIVQGARSAFGVVIKAPVAAGLETFTDNGNGVLTSDLGGTGTINYASGAYSVTFSAVTTGSVTANYRYQDPTIKGVADFTHDAVRLPGQGFQFPQDDGGDAILNVLIGQDGNYYSIKSTSAYSLALDADDAGADNLVYRKNMGLPFFRAAISTTKGIVFINTADPTKPQMTILSRNKLGTEVEPYVLFPQFDFSQFNYDHACFETYDRWTMVFCKTLDADNNNRILMCNVADKTVDIVAYTGNGSVQDGSSLYVGDSVSQTVFEIFTGFDDLGFPIDGFTTGKDHVPNDTYLSKVRRLRFKGLIDPQQSIQVYTNFDGAGLQLAGTIWGGANYVNYNESQAIGSHFVGDAQVGGDDITEAYPYFMELKIKTPKFRKMAITLVPIGIGYFDVDMETFWDILSFESKMPASSRQKQKVSLNGEETNQ